MSDPKFTWLGAKEHPPDRPGLYAFRLTDPNALRQIRGDFKFLYIGMTQSSLCKRNHKEHKNSGFSTFRRSLGALLKEELELSAIPRGKSRSEKDVTNFRFEGNGEERLTTWMKNNLKYGFFEVVQADVRKQERKLITDYLPPLNLQGLSEDQNPHKASIMNLRRKCRDEAARGFD